MSPVSALEYGFATAAVVAYTACLGIVVLPRTRRFLLDAVHRYRVAQLRATLDREERRHQQADGRDEEGT